MKPTSMSQSCILLGLGLLSANAIAGEKHSSHDAHEASSKACKGFGPQTPRDIDSVGGENKRVFTLAPPASELNLCNIHFHKNAEHKAAAFAIYAGDGQGYQCGISKKLSKAELAPTKEKVCGSSHGDLKPGDTIEVHWVHTSCDIKPGKGLGSCVSDACANPDLRVETQIFTLVNDKYALNFNELTYDGHKVNGLHQAKALPGGTGKAVEFLGSTTGPSYSEQQCSPYQVTWSVRPDCAKVDINSVAEWCKGNTFEESHAQGVRKLVTNPKLLSKIE